MELVPARYAACNEKAETVAAGEGAKHAHHDNEKPNENNQPSGGGKLLDAGSLGKTAQRKVVVLTSSELATEIYVERAVDWCFLAAKALTHIKGVVDLL
jgi:hypothetical protein